MSKGTGRLSATSLVPRLHAPSRTSLKSQQVLEGVKQCVYCSLDLSLTVAWIFLGRAWLYMALNEQAMESYVRMFLENQAVVQEHYLRLVWSQCLVGSRNVPVTVHMCSSL